jgi:glycosyltransferase involved in cell wall biosynthesis
MKVVAVFDAEVATGGAFHQAISAVLQMKEICGEDYTFEVLATRVAAVELLRGRGVAADLVRITVLDQLIGRFGLASGWRAAQKFLSLRAPLERKLQRRGCDLAYFVTPGVLPGLLQRTNYITTVLDLVHRDAPEFPEVREFGMHAAREHRLRLQLPGAYLILVDADSSASALSRAYGIDRDRILVVPFAPSPLLSAGSSTSCEEILATYSLQPGYFFYPAQFWPHKNHIRILQALVRLRELGVVRPVVFVGGDRGSRHHVEQFARRHQLDGLVRFLGVTPAAHMRGLYEGCSVVVMPTYFGPTNIPPLEAWLLQRPLVYSSRCADQARTAALCVDPDDDVALAHALQQALDPTTGAYLVQEGLSRLREIEQQRARALANMAQRLHSFARRRELWP